MSTGLSQVTVSSQGPPPVAHLLSKVFTSDETLNLRRLCCEYATLHRQPMPPIAFFHELHEKHFPRFPGPTLQQYWNILRSDGHPVLFPTGSPAPNFVRMVKERDHYRRKITLIEKEYQELKNQHRHEDNAKGAHQILVLDANTRLIEHNDEIWAARERLLEENAALRRDAGEYLRNENNDLSQEIQKLRNELNVVREECEGYKDDIRLMEGVY